MYLHSETLPKMDCSRSQSPLTALRQPPHKHAQTQLAPYLHTSLVAARHSLVNSLLAWCAGMGSDVHQKLAIEDKFLGATDLRQYFEISGRVH